MIQRQRILKFIMLTVITLGALLSIAHVKPYDILVWKAHDDLPFHLVIKFDEENNSFIVKRSAMAQQADKECGWEKFVIKSNVEQYGEEYIYAFLKQLFSLTKPYTDFSQDGKKSEIYLCKANRDNCIRVSSQLFEREGDEFTFYKYISQLK